MAYVVYGGASNKHAIIRPYCVERWAHSQTHGTNWKITQDVRLTSKNRLTSKSTDSSLTRIHSDREGAHKCIKAFTLTHLWAHYGNAIPHTVSALVPNPVWAWPLTLFPRWSPTDSEDQRGPVCFVSARYAFTATTWDSLSSRIYVSWLKPAPHGETVVVSCLYLSLSISGSVHQVHCGYLTGMN